MDKNEILNSSCDVRYSAAGNPNTPVEVLTELAKDSDWGVRRSAAGNPNTPGYKEPEYDFTVTDTYVAVKGTTHTWYKHNYPKIAPFTHADASVDQESSFFRRYIRSIIWHAPRQQELEYLMPWIKNLKRYLVDR